MATPDFEKIARRYKEEFDPDSPFTRTSLTPDQYAEWKTKMLVDQLDQNFPDWRDGIHHRKVEQKVLSEWFADDCTSLPVILRDNYPDEYIQLFLAIPWCALIKYVEVFGDAMSQEWKTNFQAFIDNQDTEVISVILAFTEAALNFHKSYGEF